MQHRAFPTGRRIATLFGVAGAAQGFEIPVDNPDLAIRWGNTFRYNIGLRTQDALAGAGVRSIGYACVEPDSRCTGAARACTRPRS